MGGFLNAKQWLFMAARFRSKLPIANPRYIHMKDLREKVSQVYPKLVTL
jgi:hypothetical protein